jgi:DNA-binding response OmpR family regulator
VYSVVLVDINLPGDISGFQAILSLREIFPELPIIVVSGASKSFLASIHTLYPNIPIIHKPFKVQELLEEVIAILRRTNDI